MPPFHEHKQHGCRGLLAEKAGPMASVRGGVWHALRRLVRLAQPYPRDNALADRFRAHQLRMLSKQGIASLPTQLGAGLALAWMLRDHQPTFLAIWSLLLLLLSGFAGWRMHRNRHIATASEENFRTGSLNIFGAACLWGTLPLFTLKGSGPQEQITILLAMTCMTSAGTVVFQNLPMAAIGWVTVLVGSTTVSMWLQGMAHIQEISIVATLYGVILIRHILMASGDFFARLYATQTAEQLSQSLAQQAQIVQGTSCSVLQLDKAGRITWVNNGFLNSSGYSLADAIGRTPVDWLKTEDRSRALHVLWPALRKTCESHVELPYRRKDGQWQWMRLDIKRLNGPGNKANSYVIVATDITDLKRSTAALKMEQDRLGHIIDGTHCGTWEIDADGGVCMMGGHWLDIIGVDTTKPLVAEGSYLMDRIHPDDRAGQKQAFINYKKGLVSHYVHEHRLRHEDGSWRWVSARGKASAYTEDGRIEQISGISMDISKSKMTELALIEATRQAKRANQAKSLFLATMSHEIRTPMNGVIGTAEWLKFTKLDAEQRDGIQTIVDSGRSLLTIIDDILDFTKVDAGRMKLEEAPMSLRDLCEGVADALMPVAKTKHVDLHVFIDPRLPARIMGDPNRLRQVLFNLVGNAIKFGSGTAEKPGQVDVQIQPADDGSQSWQLLVSDDGIGMAPETLRRLFTPFTQAEASTTRRFGGTGLGLAICHRLIELMGGGIEAHSMPGHGATFIVTLPMHQPDGTQITQDTIDLSGVDCMLLPGQNYRADTISAYLEHAGARVHTCRGEHEIEKLAQGPDIAIVIRDTPDPANPEPQGFMSSQAGGHIKCLLIGRHQHGPVRIVSSHVAQLGRAHVQDLLTAMAVLAGRQSPEVVQNESDEFEALCASIRQDGMSNQADERLILVAEDDSTNQRVIKRQLQMLGFACEIAQNGREAMEMWRSGRFDILLSDLHMPELDGYQLARQIRHEESTQGQARTPIVALTANALISEENRALACGMDEYLTKPISPKELHRCLKQWLPGSQVPRANQTTHAPDAPHAPQANATLEVCRQPDAPAATPNPPSPASGSAPVDIDVLRALVGDDEAIIQELLIDFDTSTRQQGDALSRACAASDHEQIARLAHQLKSSAKSVGAHRLGHLCEEAERQAKEQKANMASVHELMHELQQVHLHLENLIGEATP